MLKSVFMTFLSSTIIALALDYPLSTPIAFHNCINSSTLPYSIDMVHSKSTSMIDPTDLFSSILSTMNITSVSMNSITME